MVIASQSIEQKPGYKQTEVGLIPEDWEVKSLAKIADLTSSKRIFEYEYVSSGIPFYRGKEISELIDDKQVSDKYFILESRYNQIKSEFGVPDRGDILITAVGTLGNIYVVPDENKFYFKDGNLIWLRGMKNVDSYYIAAQIRRKKPEIVNNSIGSSQKALTIVVLKDILIPCPPLHEQHAIATALSDVDALIASLDQLIVKKRDIKQATMQQLLTGKMRLPGFSGEWKTKELEEIREKFVNGGTPSTQKSEYWQGNIPWITGADVVNQKISDIRRFITTEAVKNSSTSIVEKGNLLLVTRTGVGKLAIASFDVAISQDITGIYVKKEQASIKYLFHYFNYISETLRSLNQGTSIAGITKETLSSTKVSLPSLPEQQAIADILSDMDAEIVALEQRREKTRALKQGMMQELLTGKTRLL